MDLQPSLGPDIVGDAGCDSILDLPADLLAGCFSFLLDDPESLLQTEQACKRFRDTVAQHHLWQRTCEHVLPALASITAVDASQLPPRVEHLDSPAHRTSALFKRLAVTLARPPGDHSLMATALAASSTDQPEEKLDFVLDPLAKTSQLLCYWSSRGSTEEHSAESVALSLVHPLCVVTALQLRPFNAWFQEEMPGVSPVYAPQRVRFQLGGMECFQNASGAPLPPDHLSQLATEDVERAAAECTAAAALKLVGADAEESPPAAMQLNQHNDNDAAAATLEGWTSPEYEVRKQGDEVQTFNIPPTLCVGGYVRIDLLGRTQKQRMDDQYYTCLSYARAVGTPLRHFILRPVAAQEEAAADADPSGGTGWELAYVRLDPLQARGGVAQVSEGGRLHWITDNSGLNGERASFVSDKPFAWMHRETVGVPGDGWDSDTADEEEGGGSDGFMDQLNEGWTDGEDEYGLLSEEEDVYDL